MHKCKTKFNEDHQSHSCRADKSPYRHDGHADKDTYRHDGRAYSLSPYEMGQLSGEFWNVMNGEWCNSLTLHLQVQVRLI